LFNLARSLSLSLSLSLNKINKIQSHESIINLENYLHAFSIKHPSVTSVSVWENKMNIT